MPNRECVILLVGNRVCLPGGDPAWEKQVDDTLKGAVADPNCQLVNFEAQPIRLLARSIVGWYFADVVEPKPDPLREESIRYMRRMIDEMKPEFEVDEDEPE